MKDQKHELDDSFAAIVKRIGGLVARGHASGEPPEWPEIETLLTDGYALALCLEMERAQRRSVGAGHSIIERDIRWLRSILDELHLQGRRFRGPLTAPAVASAGPLDE